MRTGKDITIIVKRYSYVGRNDSCVLRLLAPEKKESILVCFCVCTLATERSLVMH